jgi:hypothetical protein
MAKNSMAKPWNKEKLMSTTPSLPEDLKRDIAHVVRSVEFDFGFEAAGTCVARTAMGYLLLKSLDVETHITVGGMVYRAGPKPERDVVAFCGPNNLGCMKYGQFLGHCWLERGTGADAEIIDFTSGDWKYVTNRDDAVIPDNAPMGHISFRRNPPEYIWAAKQGLKPIAGHYAPNLGRAWYTGFLRNAAAWPQAADHEGGRQRNGGNHAAPGG